MDVIRNRMSIVLTASGIGKSDDTFYSNVTSIFDDLSYSAPLKWHIDTEIQVIADLLDNREAQKVVGDIANQIFDTYSQHFDPTESFVIISHSAGSRLVEEGLAMLFESKNPFPVNHIMIAPAIGGSDWAEIGKLASSLIKTVLTGVKVLEDEDKSLEDFIMNLLETKTLEDILNDDIVIDKLSKSLGEVDIDLPSIERHIIYGRNDEMIEQIDPELPGKTILYKGDFNHSQVGDFSDAGLKQIYERTNGFSTQIKNIIFGNTMTKEEILTKNVGKII